MNKAYSLVLRHEKQSEVAIGKNNIQPEAAAFAVRNSSRGYGVERKCSKCKRTNHTTKYCRAHLICDSCGWNGHTAETCRRKKTTAEGGFDTNVSKGIKPLQI